MRISAFSRIGIVSVATLVIAFVLLSLSSADTSASHIPGTPQFSPIFDIRLCNVLNAGFSGPAPLPGAGPNCTQDGTPNGNPDIGTTFTVPLGHQNYAQDYFVTAVKDFTISAGHGAIPLGTAMGGLRSTVALGLGVNNCNQGAAFPEFIWWNATVDNSPANTFAVSPEGTPDRFLTLAQETIAGTTIDDDPFPQQADNNANVVLRYPDTSNRIFDPDGDGVDTDLNPATPADQPVKPLARYAGLTRVPPGGDWQLLQTFVFGAGDLRTAFQANASTRTHPFSKLGPEMGETAITLLNDPTAVQPSVSIISDFCSALGTDAVLLGMVDTTGNGVGDTARIDGPGGTEHLAQARTFSQRDADDDGIENAFDTCPFVANLEDPYIGVGPDTDAYDSACDPSPGTDTQGPPALQPGDHDGDGFKNNQDNCPSSPVNNDVEPGLSRTVAAPDGGPIGDSIGAGCDGVITPGNPAGAGNANVGDGRFFNLFYIDSVCIDNAADVDDDGWCAGTDTNDGDANVHPGGSFSARLPDAADSDGDSNIYGLANSSQEWAVGTDPLNNCPILASHDTWPPDFNQSGKTDILDIVQMTPPVFNTSPPNPNYEVRKDLDSSGKIDILDIVQMTPPVFNKLCSD